MMLGADFSLSEFLTEHWGDLASVLGVGVAVVGFWMTVAAARKSKSAAVAAKEAAQEASSRILKFDLIADLGTAISMLEEIKRLHRTEAWPVVLERYAAVKSKLVAIRGLDLFEDSDRSVLTGAIQHLANFEKTMESVAANKRGAPNFPAMNAVISDQAVGLTELHSRLLVSGRGQD